MTGYLRKHLDYIANKKIMRQYNVGLSVGLNKIYQKDNKYFAKMFRHYFGL